MVNTRLVASRFAKKADAVTDAAHAQAKWNMVRMALAALGIGAGARGAQGMYNLWKKTEDDDKDKEKSPGFAYTPQPIEVGVPVPKFGTDKNAIRISGETTPRTDTEAKPYGIAPPWLPNIPIEDDDLKAQQQGTKEAFDLGGWLSDVFAGKGATKPTEIPYYWAGMPALGMAGLYGGYKGMDYLLDRQRQEGQEEELEAAKEEFRRALRSRARAHKAASDGDTDLGVQLDRLYDQLMKRGEHIEKRALAGQAAGAYVLYAALSSLLTGAWMHEQTRKRSRQALLEAAQKHRLRQRFERRPPEILATPYELAPSKSKKKKKEEPQLMDVPEPIEA